ncbi:MAG: hypothetical protein JEZ11_14030 [Desulfobacterales bacterium]|nr:hypothetical protein [Desulfobacterales bacterium]
MSLKDEFREMVKGLAEKFAIPAVADVFFPPFYQGGQPKEAEFMAIGLKGGATGLSYLLLPDEEMNEYKALGPVDFVGKDPLPLALEFGNDDPVKEMISLAAINAICQHVMRETRFQVDSAADSLGMLSVSAGDKVGMVGLFFPLIKTVKQTGAQLVVVEKNERLIEKYPNLPITLDPAELSQCNKVLCTSTTILNHSLDDILKHCLPDALVSVIGPTAGYFPDPLFARGVDIVGGRVVKDGDLLLKLMAEGKRWGHTTQKTCFLKKTYAGVM